MGPGATAFTRMPRFVSSFASPCVKVRIAPLVTAQSMICGFGW